MRTLALFLLTLPAFAAVTGTVINRTTGAPQAGATVGLNKLGQNGIELVDQAKSDAQGKFTINQPTDGPHVLRTAFDGVTYNKMLPPGSPTTNLTIDVYQSSKTAGEAKVGKHMLLFEPVGEQITVSETFQFINQGKTAWNNPDQGTLHFYLPPAAGGKAQAQATAPGGMPIGAPVVKTAKPEIFAVDFPIKPGETRINITYTMPYKSGEPYAGKIVTKDENTYLIVPSGVTMAGEGLNDLGLEPRSQAHIYGMQGESYQVTLTGSLPPSTDAAGGDENSGPQIEQIMPRINNQTKLILAIALGILAMGFALLYRTSPKELNERGRR